MNPHSGKIVLNTAPSQDDRWLRALGPGYAPVDGRGYPELLDFAVRFGALIRYYDTANRPDGDWVDFFLADPSMLLAAIVSVDTAALRARYETLQQETARTHPFERKFELLRRTFECVLAQARLVNGWLAALEHSPLRTDAGARLRIVEAIDDELRDALSQLRSYDEGAAPPDALGKAIGLDYDGFLPIWRVACACPDSSIYKGPTRQRRIDHALPYLDPLFYAFYDFIDHLQAYARGALAVAPAGGQHQPQIALYMAFLQLFRTSQETINTFATRYADFYYHRVLREPYAGPLADSVYLTFTLADDEDVLRETVPRGTLFVAGQDCVGNDILYAADHDLTVTAATIAKLRTLDVVPEPLFGGAAPAPQLVLTAEIPPDAETPWPTFGSPAGGTAAAFGFALASQALLLTGGQRSVEIRFDVQDARLPERLAKLAELTGLAPDTILATVLEDAFTLVASTPGDWFPIGPYGAYVPDDAGFVLHFELTPSAPPLTAFDAGEEGAVSAFTNPAPSLPVLEAWLRQEPVELSGPCGCAEVFPLSLLAGLEVLAFEIRAAVTGLADMTLQNTDGLIDPAQPFPLFGAVPVTGSYLRIGSMELFTKTPESVTLNVTWFNLPPNADGFKGYYRDYVIGLSGKPEPGLFDNRVFRGGIGVLNPGSWMLDDGGTSPPDPGVYLFRTRDDCLRQEPTADGTLCGESSFDTLDVVPWQPPPYYDPAASAIVLELTDPPYAFGNVLYAPNVLSAVIADLPDAGLCQQQCLAECAPYDDAARCITDCLDGCAGAPPESCLAPCLEKCANELVTAAFRRLLRCLEGCGGRELDELRDAAAQCADLPAPERAAAIRLLLVRMRASDPESACVDACLAKFRRLLDAAACLYGCLDSSPPQDLVQCALDCRRELEAAYKASLEACMTACLSPKKELKYPNDPYLPTAQAVRVDYRVRSQEAAFVHLLPFGGYETIAARPARLLPPFPEEGVLYLGFAGLAPPQTLPLLFQLAAGDDPAAERPPVDWQYLSANHWTSLTPEQLPGDSTNGLQNSGVVTMTLPPYDPAGGTFFNDDLQWLRATVARDAARFPRTAAIVPFVLTATWQSGGVENLGTPLPAGTISAAVQDLPSIASIAQPLQSFGGRAPEDRRSYEIRLGERLRHKDRAVLGWDYERLVLERFPTVWRAAALPACDPLGCGVPGSVLVAIVPGAETQEAVNPLVPRAPGDFLARIESYLGGLASPFVALRVVNPDYVRLKVTAVVQFAGAAEPGGSIDRLNADLIHYLSPWTPDGDRGSKSPRYYTEDEISDFVQTRGYVASLVDIDFTYTPDPANLDWYFVTSAEQHRIVEDEAPEPCP